MSLSLGGVHSTSLHGNIISKARRPKRTHMIVTTGPKLVYPPRYGASRYTVPLLLQNGATADAHNTVPPYLRFVS